jgi:cytochrome c biogenesis protein CcmG/thiol:disulfide interchange protein DsbE
MIPPEAGRVVRNPQRGERSLWHFGGMVAVGVIVVGALAGPNWCGGASPLVGHPSPPMEGTIVAGEGASSHDRISLEGLRGQVVLLDFWASWCPPCRASIPTLNRVLEAHPDVVGIGINAEPNLSPEGVERAHGFFHSDFPTIQDVDWTLQSNFRVDALPTLVLIDREGIVRDVHTGVPDEGWLSERLDDLAR